MKVVVSGLAGAGKNTISELIADTFGLNFIVASQILEEIAREEGYDPGENWWDTEEGMKFLKERESDHEFDRELDRRLAKRLDEGEVVLTSWTMPWLYEKECFNIWLKASQKERARRMAGRDNINLEQALDKVKERDQENKRLYKDLYGINLGEDFEPFDLVLDTDNISIQEVKNKAIAKLKNYISE